MNQQIRPLPAQNDNYSPAQPWTCRTPAAHKCDGNVVGAMGAYPVCAAGAVAQKAADDAHKAEINAWMASPSGKRALATEARMERAAGRRELRGI